MMNSTSKKKMKKSLDFILLKVKRMIAHAIVWEIIKRQRRKRVEMKKKMNEMRMKKEKTLKMKMMKIKLQVRKIN